MHLGQCPRPRPHRPHTHILDDKTHHGNLIFKGEKEGRRRQEVPKNSNLNGLGICVSNQLTRGFFPVRKFEKYTSGYFSWGRGRTHSKKYINEYTLHCKSTYPHISDQLKECHEILLTLVICTSFFSFHSTEFDSILSV